MYIVFIASSIPTLCPCFKKYVSKSTTSEYHYRSRNRRNTHLNGDDGTNLTFAPVLPGRTKACSSADDSAEENSIMNGIMLTTNVYVRRDEGFEGIAL